MRNILTGVSLFLAVTAFTPAAKSRVYICDSNKAYAYHINPNCSGLAHCRHGVFSTTMDSAINYYGRVACKICAR
ncbi:MAG TPA: hypothetical protein VN922_04695 [Bacteroidia bacterium]|nr:hypothetical protein [Bacteroidia bacterium]